MAEPAALATVNGDGDPNVNGGEAIQEKTTQNDNNSPTTNDDPNGDAEQIKSSKRKFDDFENEDFVGFATSTTNANKKHLAFLIEKLEQELDDSPPKKKVKSNETSRPSSGMSFRSDSDVAGDLEDSSTPQTARNVNRKVSIDLASPLYRVPFEHGWKRELVYRSSSSDQGKKAADIYYYAPNGKKLRSTREVLELIAGSELTGENFTFYKEPLGVEDPEKEIIRGAKIKSSSDSPSPYDKSVDSPSDSKRTPKQKSQPLKVKSVGYRLSTDDDSKKGRKSSISSVKKNIGEDVKKRGRSGKNENGTLEPKKAKDHNKDHFTDFYAINQAKGYDSLVQIFQYLKMRELASAARVCRLWRDIASTPALWRSVRMKNSQVNDWGGLAAALKRHGTKHLDLRKMLLPSEVPQSTWDQITQQISTVDTLTRIDLCRCSASAVEKICIGLPKLEALTASSVRCQILDPSPLAGLTELKELRIKGMNGLTLSSDLKCLANLKKLKHLSLTSIKDLDKCGGCSWLSSLTELQWLELGEFTVNGQEAAEALSHLTNLTRLRLERSPIDDGNPAVLKAISKLQRLTHLELINFDIKVGFEAAIGGCKNVKRLLIIPTYVSQSATTNRCVLDGVLRLKPTLIQLVWGITIELMRVTELFIDQCDRSTDGAGTQKMKTKNKSQTGECIPVLKPVPGLLGQDIKVTPQHGPPQVEILPIPTLQRLLATQLPDTKLKILRIPYHATWRQLLNDND